MAIRPWISHLVGVIVVASVAFLFLRLFGSRRVSNDLPALYVGAALMPMLIWAIPQAVGTLARGSFGAHRLIKGASGFYFQLPPPGLPRFSRTLLMALAPFSINLLVLAQLVYLHGIWDPRLLRTSLIALATVVALSALLTSLPPGVWLLDALGLRYVDAKAGSIVPVSELFSRSLGPAGAVAGLASFIILLHTAGYSYETGLQLLSMWIATLFPAILAATCFYRIVVEPRVVPKLQAWFSREGIRARESLEEALSVGSPGSPGSALVR